MLHNVHVWVLGRSPSPSPSSATVVAACGAPPSGGGGPRASRSVDTVALNPASALPRPSAATIQRAAGRWCSRARAAAAAASPCRESPTKTSSSAAARDGAVGRCPPTACPAPFCRPRYTTGYCAVRRRAGASHHDALEDKARGPAGRRRLRQQQEELFERRNLRGRAASSVELGGEELVASGFF